MVFFHTSSCPLHEYKGQYNENDWPLSMIPKQYREKYIQAFGKLIGKWHGN